MNSSCKLVKAFLAATVLMAAMAPSSVLACAACFGRSDSPLANGMNWGILTLLGVILTVLTCFVVFFVHIVRKESDPADANSHAPVDDARPPA